MATHTTNYNLSKPETTDNQQSFIEDYATNMEIIDENMGKGSGGHTIVDESGNDLPQENSLQFTGNVNVTDDASNQKTVVDIPYEVVEVTQSQYDALPSSKFTDGKIYCITDSADDFPYYFKVVNGAVNLVFDDGN